VTTYRRRPPRPAAPVQLHRALSALRCTPTAEDIAAARAEYLGFYEHNAGYSDVDRWVIFDLMLAYRSVVDAVTTGEYQPEYTLKMLRRSAALSVVDHIARTCADEVDRLSADDRAFHEQVRQARRRGESR
jgi:hypothetical protein